MNIKSKMIGVLGMMGLVAAANASEQVRSLDLTRGTPGEKSATIQAVEPGVVEWSLPNGSAQSITLDLAALGIEPRDYDEIRFDIQPRISQVAMETVLVGHLKPGEKSYWYLKLKTTTGAWTEARYDLHLDDCGVLARGDKTDTRKALTLNLSQRVLGYPGEPKERKTLLRNFRLVRHVVSADFDPLETEMVDDAGEVACLYRIRLKNRTDQAQKVKIDLDSAGTLKYFRASGPAAVELAAKEEKTVPIKLFMPRTQAMRFAPLYSEPLFPKFSVGGEADSDVLILRGYRRFPLWGVVPPFSRQRWQPATFQAFLAAREKVLPGIAEWRNEILAAADKALPVQWPVPDFGPPIHNQAYRCGKCNCSLQPVSPIDLHRHICPQCKATHDRDGMDRAYLLNYNSERGDNIHKLALAYLLTGKTDYAEKAVTMLCDYADAYPRMPLAGTRSTAGFARLGFATLHACYAVGGFAKGYGLLADYPGFDEARRNQVQGFLRRLGVETAQHGSEYNNQQAEHFNAYGQLGLVTGLWPLVAEAIYGEFGWHELVEYGFSEDGIGLESGAYHRVQMSVMNQFAEFVSHYGLNLYTPRFQRVFDGALAAGNYAGSYEMPYRIYGNPAYLPVVAAGRSRMNWETAIDGIPGLPEVSALPVQSAHLPGAGYVILRQGNAAQYTELRFNYRLGFERSENERLSTLFFRSGVRVDANVGRITYFSPRSEWMYVAAAHNLVTADGLEQTGAAANLVALDLQGECPVAVAESDAAAPLYPDAQLLRAVALVEDAFIVFDHCSAGRPRTFDRYQYGPGAAKFSSPTPPVAGMLECLPSKGQFAQLAGGPAGKTATVAFAGNALKMRLLSDGDFELFKAVTVGGYQAMPMEVTFARRGKTTQASFLAAYSVGKDREPPALRLLPAEGGKLAFEVKTVTKTYTFTIDLKVKCVTVSAAK